MESRQPSRPGKLAADPVTGEPATTGGEPAEPAERAALAPPLRRELVAHRGRQAEKDLRQVKPGALVFQTLRGKPQSRRNALRAVSHAADVAGLNGPGLEPVGLHDLRHSMVGLALAGGLTLPEVAELARHANPRVTASMYAGLSDASRAGIARKLTESGFGA